MKKFCLLFLTVFLFSVTIFANDKRYVTEHTPLDLIGPVITYTALTQSSCTSTRTFTATITDIDGVNTTPGTRPRVYYKRTGDVNNYFDNTNGTGGWKYAEATNAGSTFTFVIDYALLSGGVTSGQTIQYFVIAQDMAATPNVGLGSATTLAIAPTSVGLTAANFPAGGAINIYNIVNALPTLMQIGAFGDFSTLTGAGGLFNAINNVGLSGNTTVEIVDALVTENNTNFLYPIQNTGCLAGTVSLLIKPAAGATPTLTGSVFQKPIITILSSNVTIDGSNNATTSRDLTITNTHPSGGNVIIYGSTGTNQISNSVLKNTNCINSTNIAGAAAIALCDESLGSLGYFKNITIKNNNVQNSLIGILCSAVSTSGNGTNILIEENALNSFAPNQIGQVGINVDGLDGAIIRNNNVGNFEPTNALPKVGIRLSSNTVNTNVSNNTISGISYTGSSPSLMYGIQIAPGVNNSNNVINSNTLTNISSAATNTVYGIGFTPTGSASGGVIIENNKISNIKSTNPSGYAAYGIGLTTTLPNSNISVANNFISDVAGTGITTIARNGHGIYIGSGGGYKIYHNTVLMNANQTNSLGTPSALMINGVTTASSLDIRNNILANTQTAGATARYAIYSFNSNTIFSNIDNNDYYSTGANLGFIGTTRATIADIQTGFTGNTNSINILPAFISSTDLHLATNNCFLDNRGTPLTITTDIDGATRDTEVPDIGADEFNAVLNNALAGFAGGVVCDNRTVATSGTNYVNVACNRIAYILPSGPTPVTGKINTCVTRDITQQTFNGEPYVQRHYDIEPATNAANATATVTLYFTDQEFVDYNTLNSPVWPLLPTVANGANASPYLGNLKVTQFHGVATTSPSTPGNYPGVRVLITPGAGNVFWNGSYWEVSFDVTGFSGFYVHTNFTNTPLPVAINYFTGRKQGNNHLLNWKVTCISTPRVTMSLERSGDSRNFTPINSITADAVRCNQPFDYADTDPLKGMNYYRLKLVDADGKISYSSIVALLNAVKGFDIISIAPNPVVNGNFKLNVASAQPGKMELSIFDMRGRLINKQILSLIAGFNSLPVNVNTVSPGTYTIRGNMADEPARILRFVKQ